MCDIIKDLSDIYCPRHADGEVIRQAIKEIMRLRRELAHYNKMSYPKWNSEYAEWNKNDRNTF